MKKPQEILMVEEEEDRQEIQILIITAEVNDRYVNA